MKECNAVFPSNILCASCHVTHWTIIYRNCSRISRGNTGKCLKVTTRSNIVTLGMPAGNKTPVITVYSGECMANQAGPMTGRWRTIIHEPLIVFCFWFINAVAAIHCVENSELYIEAIGASRLCQVRRWWKRSSLTQDVRLLHSCLLGASKPFRVRVCLHWHYCFYKHTSLTMCSMSYWTKYILTKQKRGENHNKSYKIAFSFMR